MNSSHGHHHLRCSPSNKSQLHYQERYAKFHVNTMKNTAGKVLPFNILDKLVGRTSLYGYAFKANGNEEQPPKLPGVDVVETRNGDD